jgi:gas vesicle protein
MAVDNTPLLDELNTVEENCLYTAQAHFAIGNSKGTVVKVVYIGAAVLSAIGGALVAAGLPSWLGILPTMGGVVGAVATALGADKNVHTHFVAANVLTKLRHEARALRETFSSMMSQEELARETLRITNSYNNMIQGLPPTDKRAMNEACSAIQTGRFQPDFRASTNGAKILPASQVGRDDKSA